MGERDAFVLDRHGLLRIKHWEEHYPGLAAGFTTRLGGRSHAPYNTFNLGLHVGDQPADVVANRKRLAARLGLSFAAFTCAEQTHGSNVYYVQNIDRGRGKEAVQDAIPNVDAIYTDQADILLVSFYADCVPLFFFDPQKRLIGLAHAGWKGTAGRIGVKLISAWVEQFGSQREDIRVVLGPSIGGCCYEVDDRVVDQFASLRDMISDGAVQETGNGKYDLDLKQINVDFLREAGILEDHIEVSRWCTSCDRSLFFSHRRDRGKTGRMASFLALKKESS